MSTRVTARRDEVTRLLAERGFTNLRLPSEARAATSTRVELLVTGDTHVDLGNFLAAQDAVSDLVGFEVALVSSGSVLGASLTDGSAAL